MESFVCVEEFEKSALAKLAKSAGDYYRSGATAEQSLAENKAAFNRLRILPKCLRDVSKMDLSTRVLGCDVQIPFGLAPTALQKMAHPHGEIGTAKAAGNLGTVFILSTISSTSLEDVASSAPDTIKWFQLYIYSNREITKNLIKRAEKAGFKAIVLTVDTPYFGIRRSDVRNHFSLPPGIRFANFDGLINQDMYNSDNTSGFHAYVKSMFDPSLIWDDIAWLKSVTNLPIIAKGVLRVDDALAAVKSGVAGIIVSNHGARQVDGTPATIEVLPSIVEAVKDSGVEVYLDGGVSQGTDVLKALALGAKMVFCGRPALWGLANGGQKGVERVMTIIKMELESAMAISGVPAVSKIGKDLIVHQSVYSKL